VYYHRWHHRRAAWHHHRYHAYRAHRHYMAHRY
jgi:hypothetical protein